MYLTIVLRKEVPDTNTAQQLTDFVKEQLEPYPDVKISSSVSETITPTEDPPS